jgi:glutamate-1-semialdehyde 2,1-aminomutase
VPQEAVAHTALVRYNDLDAVEQLFQRVGEDIAAVIVEPVAGNMGVVPPVSGFLDGLRRVTNQFEALLIFDEVMTGWRVHPTSAQALYRVRPDLTCLGKVIGGGLPAAAFGGRRDLMELIAPAGPVYQAGTLSGNPVAMAAGLATLEALDRPGLWESAEGFARQAAEILRLEGERAGVDLTVEQVGTMLAPFFGPGPIRNYDDVRRTDRSRYARFFHSMLEGGVYLPPSAFEAWFTSSAHGESELARFHLAVEHAMTSAAHTPDSSNEARSG